MASSSEICNLALSHIGVGKEVANYLTEKSEEAAACRRFFTLTQDAVLRDFPWPFAKKIATLALIEEDPTDEAEFSYRYPTDCIFIRKLLSGIANDTRQSRVPYTVAYSETGRIILCNIEDAQLEYTIRISDPEKYPPDFAMAFSLRLAHYIAPRLTGGDAFKVGERALKLYEYEISKAKVNSLNEQQGEEEVLSELERARN